MAVGRPLVIMFMAVGRPLMTIVLAVGRLLMRFDDYLTSGWSTAFFVDAFSTISMCANSFRACRSSTPSPIQSQAHCAKCNQWCQMYQWHATPIFSRNAQASIIAPLASRALMRLEGPPALRQATSLPMPWWLLLLRAWQMPEPNSAPVPCAPSLFEPARVSAPRKS